ncbi:phage tail length tape measure family protein [Stenotrophomonas terrae]|uniref:phage tail length tape measure family protein n=1 Tax=Stenotrophomonas terrae TaxID=405446 RepID=UPI003208B16D
MANRDFELTMRARADFDSARREITGTSRDLGALGDAAVGANDKLAQSSRSGSGTDRIRDMVQKSLAELEGARALLDAEQASAVPAQSGVAGALQQQATAYQSLAAASRTTQQNVAAEIALIGQLEARLARGASSADDLADTEAALDVAMRKGLVTTDQYDEALSRLNEEQVKLDREAEKSGKTLQATVSRYDKATAGLQRLVKDEAQLKAAVDAGRISREQYNRAMAAIGNERAKLLAVRDGARQAASAMAGLNLESASAQRNLSQMVSYAVSGQWQLAGSQIMQMGNEAGLMGGLVSGAGLAIAGVLATVGGLTAAVVSNYIEMRAFDSALISTGYSAGVTSSALAGMRNEIGGATGNYGNAQAALEALAGSGKVVSDALEASGAAAVNLAELTGRSIEQTTAEVLTLADAPTEGLLKLNERYRFLTLEVYENVKSLEDQGRAQEATRVATDALAAATATRVAEMRANAGSLERAWYDVRDSVRSVWQQVKDIGRDDAEARIAAGQRGILMLNDQRLDVQRRLAIGGIDKAEAARAEQQLRSRIALEQQNIAQWRERKGLQDEAAAAKAEELRVQDQAVRAAASVDRDMARIDKKVERQQRLNELVEKYNQIAVANPSDKRLFDGSYEKLKAAIEKETDGGKPKSGTSTAKQAGPDDAALREIDNLERQVALLADLGEGQQRTSEFARIRYEVEQGAYRNASEAVKQQLVDQSQLLDSERARREEAEKNRKLIEETGRSYEQLTDALRTPAEAALDKAIDQINVLNAAIKAGIADQAVYDETLQKIFTGSFTKAPTFQGISPEIAGPFGELNKISDAQAELEAWYQTQLDLNNKFRAEKKISDEMWNQQEQALKQQHEDALARIESARHQVMLAGAADAFGSLAEMAKSHAGEQSRTYRVLFAISKGFAVAQAAVALAQNVAEASKQGWPQNIPAIAAAFAQGATIASLLSAAEYATGGRIRGSGTGTSDDVPIWASNDEFMVRAASAREPGAYAFLDDFNQRGMSALYDWQQFADGGRIAANDSVAGPNWSRVNTSATRAAQAGGSAALRLYNLFDLDALAQAVANHPATEKQIVNVASQNGQAIRAEWNT